ncbi:MAG TPA: low temperature requirement protein A [Acidimicrobiales bacterium]
MEAIDAPPEPRVSALELFFDLVFVFGFTQITGTITAGPTAANLGRGLLIFLVLWWAWGAYAWLTNAVSVDEKLPRVVVMTAAAAMLVTALAVPTAWEDGGVAFALGFLVVIVLHAVLFAVAGENPETTRGAIMRLAPTNVGAALVLVVAGAVDGTARPVLWVAAVVITYAGPYLTGVAGFGVHPAHLAERHGLIVIIALGESVVAIGSGGDIAVDWGLAGTALLIMGLLIGLWWTYFDHEAEEDEAALTAAAGVDQARMARDVYSYLHVPLVLGVVFAAVGIHEALLNRGEPLDPVFAAAFAGGVALYLGGLAAIRLRRGSRPGAACLAALVVALAMIPVGKEIDAVASAAILAAVVLAVAFAERPRSGVLESSP